jgi:hypothetical protein
MLLSSRCPEGARRIQAVTKAVAALDARPRTNASLGPYEAKHLLVRRAGKPGVQGAHALEDKGRAATAHSGPCHTPLA